MGFLDDAKNAVSDGVDKAKDLADEHSDKIVDGIDKAADFADDKTGGKYDDQIDAGAEKAKDALGVDDVPPAAPPTTPPAPPAAPPA